MASSSPSATGPMTVVDTLMFGTKVLVAYGQQRTLLRGDELRAAIPTAVRHAEQSANGCPTRSSPSTCVRACSAACGSWSRRTRPRVEPRVGRLRRSAGARARRGGAVGAPCAARRGRRCTRRGDAQSRWPGSRRRCSRRRTQGHGACARHVCGPYSKRARGR